MVKNAEKLQGRGLVGSPAVSVRTTTARAVAHTTALNQLTKRRRRCEEEVHWVTGHAWKQAEAEAWEKRLKGNAVVSSSSSGRCLSAYTCDEGKWMTVVWPPKGPLPEANAQFFVMATSSGREVSDSPSGASQPGLSEGTSASTSGTESAGSDMPEILTQPNCMRCDWMGSGVELDSERPCREAGSCLSCVQGDRTVESDVCVRPVVLIYSREKQINWAPS